MSEQCLSRTPKAQFSTLLRSNFILLCSFILSHPLYFSYFIFFSPYLLKLISFLSRLFITTSILLLLTISAALVRRNSPPDDNDELHDFEKFEAYRIVFDGTGNDSVEVSELNSEEKSVEVDQSEATNWPVMEEKTLESFFKELDVFEDAKSDEVSEEQQSKPSVIGIGSEAIGNNNNNNISDNAVKFGTDDGSNYSSKSENSPILDSNLGKFGSMRREKEWKRTLACKLFEERHNVDGGDEGMDSLWEAYEMDSSKANAKIDSKMKNMKMEYYHEDDEDEEAGETNAKLCCLQALKFSAGKMNLGMGRPNLVRISKALKGFGWLHHVKSHGKKR